MVSVMEQKPFKSPRSLAEERRRCLIAKFDWFIDIALESDGRISIPDAIRDFKEDSEYVSATL
jgi:hypothetical protein